MEDGKMNQALHFTVGEGINDLVRQAYWFEQRKKWAMDVLDCFRGITESQKMAILEGNARLIPIEEGRRMRLMYRPDEKFKAKLRRYKKWEVEHFYFLAGVRVTKSAVNEYRDFVVMRYRMMLFRPQFFIGHEELVIRMEQIREFLHENIINETQFKGRKGEGYNAFECALGKLVDEKALEFKQSFDRGEFGREMYYHSGFINKLKQDYGDWDKWTCDICGVKLFMQEDRRCGSCNNWTCVKCYDKDKDMCLTCSKPYQTKIDAWKRTK